MFGAKPETPVVLWFEFGENRMSLGLVFDKVGDLLGKTVEQFLNIDY